MADNNGDDDEGLVDLNSKKVHQLKDVMNFGKHKGWTVEQVLNRKPDYLLWAQDAIEWFEVDDSILEAAAEKVEGKRGDNNNRTRPVDELFRQQFDDYNDDNDEIPF